MLNICGVPQSKFRSICSAIDKLDKLPWDQVKKEMVEEKGLQQEVADKIGGLVQKRGNPWVLLEELQQVDSPFSKDPSSVAALEELGVLFKGLDYYTGVIYEAIFKGSTQVGSIAAGGRYDDLVGMFSGKQVPAVGVSLGIERVFAIMEKQEEDRKSVLRSNETQVLVVVLGKDERWTEEAIKIFTDLWEGRLKARDPHRSWGEKRKNGRWYLSPRPHTLELELVQASKSFQRIGAQEKFFSKPTNLNNFRPSAQSGTILKLMKQKELVQSTQPVQGSSARRELKNNLS
ncbi:unnamed protein product [Calypogeia fissa]